MPSPPVTINTSFFRGLFDKFGARLAAEPFELNKTVQPVAVVDAGEPYYLEPPSITLGQANPADQATLVQFTAPKQGVYTFVLFFTIQTVNETFATAQFNIRVNSASGVSLWQMAADVRFFNNLGPNRIKVFLPELATLTLIKSGASAVGAVWNSMILVESWYGK